MNYIQLNTIISLFHFKIHTVLTISLLKIKTKPYLHPKQSNIIKPKPI
ncbi:hypothetical protein CLU82_0089 [Flavobacterium sp. 5]|nr:hypothetical protein CLU82_0089 [Flavobacterium sp. 5]